MQVFLWMEWQPFGFSILGPVRSELSDKIGTSETWISSPTNTVESVWDHPWDDPMKPFKEIAWSRFYVLETAPRLPIGLEGGGDWISGRVLAAQWTHVLLIGNPVILSVYRQMMIWEPKKWLIKNALLLVYFAFCWSFPTSLMDTARPGESKILINPRWFFFSFGLGGSTGFGIACSWGVGVGVDGGCSLAPQLTTTITKNMADWGR